MANSIILHVPLYMTEFILTVPLRIHCIDCTYIICGVFQVVTRIHNQNGTGHLVKRRHFIG